MMYLYYVLAGVISYFVGNLTFARFIAKANHGDITKSGSGNPGTLNTWRRFGFWAGILTFILDMVKGLLVSLGAYFLFNHFGMNGEVALYVAGFSAILGHNFPIIFKFKGGKGIATSVGVFFAANWLVALIAFIVMILGMIFVKYASIFTIGFAVFMSIWEICVCSPANWVNYILIALIAFLVLFCHRGNIKRLIQGKENKTELWKMVCQLGKKKTKSAATEPTATVEALSVPNSSTENRK